MGAQSAICSGGRYDGLVAQLGGRDTPAIGWALGIERVVELIEAEDLQIVERLPHAYLTMAGERAQRMGFTIAEELRGRVPGVRLSMDCLGGSLKSQLRRADRSGARMALILGDDELDVGQISVKELREDTAQVMLTMDATVSALLRVRRESP